MYFLIVVKVQLEFFVVADNGDYAFYGSGDHFCLDLEEGELGEDGPLVLVVFVADGLQEFVGEGADLDTFYDELLE